MKETELRAHLKSIKGISDSLVKAGWIKTDIEQLDIMFDYPDARLFKSGKKIRVRKENDYLELTYKGVFEGDSNLSKRTEINLDVSTNKLSEITLFFDSIGYPLLFQIPKHRTLFIKGAIKITIDKWPIIGYLLEIEGDELEIRKIAKEEFPNTEFYNYRLKDLFLNEASLQGKEVKELIEEYEKHNSVKLGRIDLIIN